MPRGSGSSPEFQSGWRPHPAPLQVETQIASRGRGTVAALEGLRVHCTVLGPLRPRWGQQQLQRGSWNRQKLAPQTFSI